MFDGKAGRRRAPKVLHTYESVCARISCTEMQNYVISPRKLTTQAIDELEIVWKED